MIYTVTFNPSLDYILTVPDFSLHETNRASQEQLFPGGKGINVSMVLKNLHIPNKALGFAAGFTGQEIIRALKARNLDTDFIQLPEGMSRINVKLKNYDGTEINGQGPVIDAKSLSLLMEQLDCLREGDTLILAGSIPSSLPPSIYGDILARLMPKKVRFVVDASSHLLLEVLKYHPFLIKPNQHELGELFSQELTTRESVVPYARKLQEQGARNVCVSMAGEGAVLLDEEGSVHMLSAPKGTLVNAVGAGDSMVAGFLAGWEETHDYEYAFRMGVAAGSASAFSESLACREEIMQLLQGMQQ